MIRGIADEPLRAQLIRAERARAAGFTWQRSAERTIAVYERAFSDRSSSS